MYYRRLMLGTFVATLGASFLHQASAQWLSGGTTTISRKSLLSGLDLFCDLSRVSFNGDTIPEDKRVKIVTLPSEASGPNVPPSLTFNGEMFCAEVEPGTSGLENAATRNGVELVGRFKLEQQAPKITPQEGLEFSGPDGSGVRTWTFVVPVNPDFPFPELLYDLVPANQATANKFCEPGSATCKALIGLELPATQGDYPERDLDGTAPNDLALGEVFKFTTRTNLQGVEAPGQFYWGPCHSGSFGTYPTYPVLARQNASHQGTGVQTINVTPDTRVAVTVNQNDLWNSGGQSGWSNADGRIRQMFSTGNDDSGATANTLIGTVDSLSADNSHRLWRFVNGQWESATEAAIGTLVGSTDGVNFYILNTAFDGQLPITGVLRLYYWDRQRNDNTQFVTATVAADSIQCGVTTVASSQVRGERKVEVEGFPVLNVTNTSDTAGFPFAVLGCNQGDATIAFGPDGSPIDLSSGQVLVNNIPVAIQSFTVVDTTSRPSCDGGQSLADLNLKLNRLQFIGAVVPPNCKNGPIAYSVALGSAANGWYGGQDTVDLQNCKKK